MNRNTRREFLIQSGGALMAAGGCAALTPLAAASTEGTSMKPPNFVIFLTDDQGYGDLGCVGATDLKTPHLDALAASGVRFTDWYSNAPVCSPSRAALMTGRYPAHAGVRSILAGHRTAPGLPQKVPTIAEALKPLGYQTAMFGKWHLGAAESFRPHHHGFDEWFGFLAGCIDYYSHIFYWGMAGGKEDPVHDLWENDQEIFANGQYFTEMIAERAMGYVQRAAAKQQPFFLYIPFNAPHYPMHAPQKYLDRFPNLPPERRIMAAMISAVDDAVGAIVEELKTQGVYENTCIFFMSDNGPSRETRNWLDNTRTPYYGGTPGPFKGHKFSLYEGGIRVPGLISWPACIPSGQVISEPAAAMDIFPTFLNAAGGDLSKYSVDGCDILPMLTQHSKSPHEAIFWEQGKQTALRKGNWKLVLNGQLVENAPPEDAVHLSDLKADPGERINLKDAHPDIAASMKKEAERWRAEIGAMK